MSKSNTNELTAELGTARRAINAEKTKEWHELRKTGIGGSEVASIVGISPWRSAISLWAEKTGTLPREEIKNDAVEWGVRLEAVVLDKLEDEHPEFTVFRNVGSWTHAERLWQISNPDGIFKHENGYGIIEVKTAAYEDDWKADGQYVCPAYYETQVQWYLQTFGFDRAIVAVLFAGRKYIEIEVLASSLQQDVNLEAAEKFRECVTKVEQPDWDGSSSTVDTIRRMNPELDGSAVELADLGKTYLQALEDYNTANGGLNNMKARVLSAMGGAKRGTIGDVTIVTRMSRAGGLPYLVNKKGN
jgi:putative phage-type endonuclease